MSTEYQCDCHKNEIARGALNIWFWEGSKYDMKQGSVYLCDKCAEEMLEYLKKKFKKDPILNKIEEF